MTVSAPVTVEYLEVRIGIFIFDLIKEKKYD